MRMRNDCLKLGGFRIPLKLDLESIECENVRYGCPYGIVDVRCDRYAGREGLSADGGAPRVCRRKVDLLADCLDWAMGDRNGRWFWPDLRQYNTIIVRNSNG